MSKRGFTLIEILGVVIVLAIISIISIPIVLNITEGIRKSALETSVKGLIASADIYYTRNMDKISSPIEFVVTNGQQEGTKKLSYNGKVENAYLMLFENNDKAVCADDGKYAASKGVNDKKITVVKGNCLGYDEAYKGYVVGDANGFTSLNIKAVTDASQLGVGKQNYIRVVTTTSITGFYVSATPPVTPSQGMVWVVQANNSPYYLESDEVKIGVSYVMQYEDNKWMLKQAYVYNKDAWKLLYYVDMLDGNLNLENSNLGDIEITKNYEYTGEYQEFIAPFTGYYNVEAWGAQGGNYNAQGGKGAYTKGKLYLNIGEKIYIYVGGMPTNSSGGWNGGGAGYGSTGRGGGGATDVRLETDVDKKVWNNFESLKTRIMVAAGGGGAGNRVDTTGYSAGGAGGGLTGNSGNGTFPGSGGTQSSAGFNPSYGPTFADQYGGFGYGGAGSYRESGNYHGGGGGAGYYGGGGAIGYGDGSGGGGSSYISGYEGCSSIDIDLSTSKNDIVHTGSAYFNNKYYFKNSDMQIGINQGNGHAKITIISVEIRDDKSEQVEINNKKYTYSYSGTTYQNGRYQIFTVPTNGYYNIEAWGAQGGNYNATGGLGGYTKGKIYLEKGTKLYVYVGSQTVINSGGWNGGGNGYGSTGRGGGGATDIRLIPTTKISTWDTFDSLKTRIMVAAGGGGAGNRVDTTGYSAGGAGGGLTGNSGNGTFPGSGGTQSSAGFNSSYGPTFANQYGGFGYGGAGSYLDSGNYHGGGGGAGYYGGGGAIGYGDGGGGGGSSYISGYEGCSSISKDSESDKIIHNGNPYHYSGKYFTSIEMRSGQNSGHGKVIIQLENEKTVESSEINSNKNKKIKYSFEYSGTTNISGRYQIFEVLVNGYYNIEAWGAQGGNYNATGGLGGYTKGKIYLQKGTKLYIYVGSKTFSTNGGWNGGGSGYGSTGRGGGGATDIRLKETANLETWNEFDSLKTRIMVAAGGGGAGNRVDTTGYSAGGAGGGLTGNSGNGTFSGSGGTQSSPGYQPSYAPASIEQYGGFGYGGKGSYRESGNYHGGGGGAGYYGGGGAIGYGDGAGGGGSSYISGYEGCSSITKDSITDSILHNGNIYHYSNNYFLETEMQKGINSGNGKVIINLVEEKEMTSFELEKLKNYYKTYNYDFSGYSYSNGRYQIFDAPLSGYYEVKLWGAQGGNYNATGGLGAYTKGDIYLEKGTKLYVYVGSQPVSVVNAGGWNGGGTGYSSTGRGGGGATDIRSVSSSTIMSWSELSSQKSRIMVAAGGGGAGNRVDTTGYSAGGAAGGLIGYTGNGSYAGTGGTQISAGYQASYAPNAANQHGGLGYGGIGSYRESGNYHGGGGGAGYYGGGGAIGYGDGAGGGGSSYISGHAGCIAITSSGTPKVETYSNLSDSVSYMGYKFTNTLIIDGQGYNWETIKSQNVSKMTSKDGASLVNGNTGNGYAKITYLGE